MPLPDSSRPDALPNSDRLAPCVFIGSTLDERPIWFRLCESLRDTFFPPKPPPLELTSIPVAVPDRMMVKTNPWAIGTSTVVNGTLVALLLLAGLHTVVARRHAPSNKFTLSDFPFFAPQKAHPSNGDGGGGTNDSIDAIKGRLPRIEPSPVAPPQVPLLEHPRLAIDPAIAVPLEMKLPDNPALPNVGVHTSANVTLLSNGPGAHGGMGIGLDGGLGPGSGLGAGPGFDQGAGGQIYTPGGGVTSPIPIVTPEAEFSDEARRSKFQGVCMISLIVDAQGNPVNPRLIRRLGMGLDEKALEAVRGYRFKPALRHGKAVPVLITVAVDFRLY